MSIGGPAWCRGAGLSGTVNVVPSIAHRDSIAYLDQVGNRTPNGSHTSLRLMLVMHKSSGPERWR